MDHHETRRFERRFVGITLAAAALMFGAVLLVGLVGCDSLAPANIEAAAKDAEAGFKRLEEAQALLADDPVLGQAAIHVAEAGEDFRRAWIDLFGPDWHPKSEREAGIAAALLGYGESCGNRCWDCGPGSCPQGQAVCNFFSCLANCGHHHPLCCYGCSSEDEAREGDPGNAMALLCGKPLETPLRGP